MLEQLKGAFRHPNVQWRAPSCVLATAAAAGIIVAALASPANASPTPSPTATSSTVSSSAASSASASAPAAPASSASAASSASQLSAPAATPKATTADAGPAKPKPSVIPKSGKSRPKSAATSIKRNTVKANAATSPKVTFAGASYSSGVVSATFDGSGIAPGSEGADVIVSNHPCTDPTVDPGDSDCLFYTGKADSSGNVTKTIQFNASACPGTADWDSSDTQGLNDYGSGTVTWSCAPTTTNVTAMAPTFTDSTCATPTKGSYTINPTTGVVYTEGGKTVTGTNSVTVPTSVTVTATSSDTAKYTLTGTTVFTHVYALPTGCNIPPVAVDDIATTDENTATTIPVLANDTDANHDTLSVATFDSKSVSGGTVTLVNNELQYLPAPGFSGVDTFHYTAGDGKAGSNTATVTVTVKPTVMPPPQPAKPTVTVGKDSCVMPGATDGSTSITVTNTADATKAAADYTVAVTSPGMTNVTLHTGPILDGASKTLAVLGLQPGNYGVAVTGDDMTGTGTSFTLTACTTPVMPTKHVVSLNVAATGANCGPQAIETYYVSFDMNKVAVVVTVGHKKVPLRGPDSFTVDSGQVWSVDGTVKDSSTDEFSNHRSTLDLSGKNAEKPFTCPGAPIHQKPVPKPANPRNPDYSTNATGPTGTSSILPGWVWGFITFGGISAVGLGALNKRRRRATPRLVQG